ncbi:uncharacterized protein F5147DRAFT_658694 [Suillus discolor]|uniref:Uncharacterized protein n=1 Tax=Suillus discolor TaxID=1912936 RepID=A0A9P7ESF3_9AGAM|nr:uncharacterized protein F5147DRAFT_658694 [Suillus discolor]KAG2088474.1 hypothetical protein F5147DRAFT_658694 [Suillus discolor]
MAKASTQVRKVKEPRKCGRPPKKQLQPPSSTQAEHPPSQEVGSKTKPRPWPIPPEKSSTLLAATVPGGSSSAPDIRAAVATSKSTDFDENTAATLLLGLAWPVGDLEVPDLVGKYSIKDEDFFQNLKESEASGLDDEHSQSGDEEESESEDSVEDNEEPETDEEVIDIPLNVLVNGVLDTLTVRSDISWDAFHRKIAKAMEIFLENLSIAYKFSTNAKTASPHKLDLARNLLQLLGDASEELSGVTGRSRKKKFAVEIVDIRLLEVSNGELKKGTLTSSKTKNNSGLDCCDTAPGLEGLVPDPWRLYASWTPRLAHGSVTPTRAPALPTPAPALLDSPRGGAPPAPRTTAVWTAMTPPQGAMTPPDAMTPPLA